MSSKSAEWLKVEKYLQSKGITFQVYEHPPVFTVAEGKKYKIDVPGLGCKSLFLKEAKGAKYILYTLPGEKRANLRQLAEELGEKRLTFAKPVELEQLLGVTPGSVSPFSILNDRQKKVILVIDREVIQAKEINVHPNDNRASLVLTQEMFRRFLSTLDRPYQLF